MVVAKRSGLEVARVIEALDTSLASSAMMHIHGRTYIATQDFPKGLFPMSFSEKDTCCALDCARDVGVKANVVAASNALYNRALQGPWKDYYSAGIFRVVEDEAGA